MSNLRVLNPGYGDMKLLVVTSRHKFPPGEGKMVKDGVLSVVIAEALGTEKCCDIHIGMVMMYRYPP